MGRSMSLVSPEWLKTQQTSGSVADKKNQVQFDVYPRDGKLYQTEYQSGPDGPEVFRDTHEVEWIIGAGENGFGGLVRRGDYLFQAPLSFYSKAGQWELSPGYEFGNYGFNRPILPACIGCHSGRPNALSDGNGRFGDPPFSELAIGCENCHGPGLSHVLAAQMSADTEPGHDPFIVNPALLTPALADNICMSCHQTGDVRVLKPGKQQHRLPARGRAGRHHVHPDGAAPTGVAPASGLAGALLFDDTEQVLSSEWGTVKLYQLPRPSRRNLHATRRRNISERDA